MHNYYVYILTNKSNKVLYTGITNDLETRLLQHKNKDNPKSFTAKYNVTKLVYYEYFTDVQTAINREKQIKNWRRSKKIYIIEQINSEWDDISDKEMDY